MECFYKRLVLKRNGRSVVGAQHRAVEQLLVRSGQGAGTKLPRHCQRQAPGHYVCLPAFNTYHVHAVHKRRLFDTYPPPGSAQAMV